MKSALTWPLGLQRIVVHSGPVPHLCCSFHKKSEGGLCLDKLAADHTYKVGQEEKKETENGHFKIWTFS